jgi:uncharacterized protein YeaO (DUF488 family)
MIKTKSVWSPIDRKSDGLRILATRFRGRGLPTNRYDVWMASLGPSEQLLKKWLSGRLAWPEFAREYRVELFLEGRIDSRCMTIKNHGQKFTLRLIKQLARKGTVTLLCHCGAEQVKCHRHLLQKMLSRGRI